MAYVRGLTVVIFRCKNRYHAFFLWYPGRWLPKSITDVWSTSVQVMAWCHQATSHYLNQLRPSSMTPYAITRPQCLQVTGTKESLLSNYIHQNCIWRLVSNKRLSAGISNPIPCNYTSIIHATYLFAGTSSQIMLYNHDNMFYELTHRWLHMA